MPRQLHGRLPSFQTYLALIVAAVVTAVLLLWAPSAGAALEITGCGEVVPPGETAYLTGDLDCAGADSEGVVLSHRSRLVLGGYAMVGGGPTGDERVWQGVRCRTGSVCTVIGPGTISGFSASGVAGTRVRVRDVLISANGRAGVAAYENVLLRGVVLESNARSIHAGGRVKLRGTSVGPQPQAGIVAARAPLYRPRCAQRGSSRP